MKRSFSPCATSAACRFALILLLTSSSKLAAQPNQHPPQPPNPGPMLAQGVQDFQMPDLTISLVRSSQTVAGLKPTAANGFAFGPGDLLTERSNDGYYHLGDATLRPRGG